MAINPLVATMLFGMGKKPGMTGTPPFVPPQNAPMATPQGSGGFFDKADQFLSRPGGNFLLNLLAQDGYSTMPQSPLAAVGRAGLMTQQQQQQAGMADLERRMLESQIGLNTARADSVAAGGSKANNPFGAIDPSKFTRESIEKFERTGRYGDLELSSAASSDPAAVQEFKFFQNLTEDQKREFLTMKRDPRYTSVPGAGFGAANPVTGSFDAVVSEDTVQEGTRDRASSTAMGTAEGKSTADAVADLPKSEIRAQTALDALDRMESHPGFSGAVGMKGPSQLFGLRDKPVAGTDAADFVALAEQVSGTAFLEAFQELKGGGHITEIEGQKAEQAIARIRNLDQSEGAYKEAIGDLRSIIKQGLNRKRNAAGAPESAAPVDMDFSSMSDDELRRLAGGQ